MPIPDLEAALTGARLVEEAGALLTHGEDPDRMVAHAFERLGELVPYDLATVLLREGDGLRVAHADGAPRHAPAGRGPHPRARQPPAPERPEGPFPPRHLRGGRSRARTPSTACWRCPTATAAWWHPCAAGARPSA